LDFLAAMAVIQFPMWLVLAESLIATLAKDEIVVAFLDTLWREVKLEKRVSWGTLDSGR
jgi:hypothetical protein